MSCSKWRWTEACDGRPCVGDCDLCSFDPDDTGETPESPWEIIVKSPDGRIMGATFFIEDTTNAKEIRMAVHDAADKIARYTFFFRR